MKRLMTITTLLVVLGCATTKVWVVDRTKTGGVIGYRGSPRDVTQEFQSAAVELCGDRPWKIVSETPVASRGHASVPVPKIPVDYDYKVAPKSTTGKIDASTSAKDLQKQRVDTEDAWTEAKISCAGSSNDSARYCENHGGKMVDGYCQMPKGN